MSRIVTGHWRRIVAIAATLALMGTASCSGEKAADPPATSAGVIGPEGATAVSGPVTVRANADAAPHGIELLIKETEAPPLLESVTFTPAAMPVDVSLSDGSQPRSPLALTLDGLEAAPAGAILVFLTRHDGVWESLPVTVTGSTAAVELNHLSPGVFGWAPDNALAPVTDGVSQFLGQSFPEPDCKGKPADYQGRRYRVESENNKLYACVTSGPEGIKVEVLPNSPYVWRVRSDLKQAKPSPPKTGLDIAAISTSVVYQNLFSGTYEKETIVMPDASASFTVLDGVTETTLNASVDAGLGLVTVLTQAVEILLTMNNVNLGKAEYLEYGECLADVMEVSTLKTPNSGDLPGLLRTVLGCGSNYVAPSDSVLFAIVGGLSGSFVTQVRGAIDTVTQSATTRITLRAEPLDATRNPPGPRAPAPETVAAYAGTWIGPVTQPGAPAYNAELTLLATGGQVSGTVRYPGLDCSGELRFDRWKNGVLHLRETIQNDPKRTCVPGIDIELHLDADRLEYAALATRATDAKATLTRQP